jgi:hypothetical protein
MYAGGAPVSDGYQREVTRRSFMAHAGGGVVGASLLAQALEWLADAEPAAAQLGLSPTDPAVRRTMAAFADTIVPGPAGGAHDRPGAIEAGALEEAYDPFYGAANVYPLLHHELQLATRRVLGRPARFDLSLAYADRERVVLDRIVAPGSGGRSPHYLLFQGAAILIYVAYYGTARSTLGPEYIRFPPHSDGYAPGHSYAVEFEGMTRDGNPR